jgi:hypothetical protein
MWRESRVHGAVKLSAMVAPIVLLGAMTARPEREEQARADPLEEARKKPESVETLILSRRGLDEVPEVVFQLPKLKALYLSENRIAELPARVGELKNLTVLDLDGNRIRSLPEEMGELTKLTRLSLYRNPLESLPGSLPRLRDLKELYLFDTQLHGKIPSGLLQLLKEGSPELQVAADWEEFDDIEEYRLATSRRIDASFEEPGGAYLALGIEESVAAAGMNVFSYRHEGKDVKLFDPGLEGSATVSECSPDNPALDALAPAERIPYLKERCKPELFSVSPRGTGRLTVSRVTVENVEVCGDPAISVAAQTEAMEDDVLLVVSSTPPPGSVVVSPDSLRLSGWPGSTREEDFGFPKGVHLTRVTFFEHPGSPEGDFLAEVATRGLHFITGEEGKDYQWIEATWMFYVGPRGVVLLSPPSGEWPYIGGPDASFRAAADLDGNGELDLVLGKTDMVVLFRHRGGYLRRGMPYSPPRGC